MGGPAADAAAAQVLSGVAVLGGQAPKRGRLTAAERAELGHIGLQAAMRRLQPGTDPMMAAWRERTASAATHSSMRCSQAVMPTWRASSVAAEHGAVCGSSSAQSLRRRVSTSLSCRRFSGRGAFAAPLAGVASHLSRIVSRIVFRRLGIVKNGAVRPALHDLGSSGAYGRSSRRHLKSA